VAVALGGFKQPQQLIALNYFVSLGAAYDYVINLDGFNEIVLPFSDNRPYGIFPSFPRHWNVYSQKLLDRDITLLLGTQAYLKAKQGSDATRFATSLIRYSNFALFIWKIRDQQYSKKIFDAETQLREKLVNAELEPQTRGPGYSFSDTTSFFEEQVKYWAQCSKQMHALATQSGFSYFHFLQPNQYLEGSKILTEEELEIAYEQGNFAYKDAVRKAYPMLISEGAALSKSGVIFIDLTMLFREEKASIYADKCCHLNKRGYDLIVTQIVSVITQE
jgi:hypothetical protein